MKRAPLFDEFRARDTKGKAYARARMRIECEQCAPFTYYQFLRKFETDPCTPGSPARLVRGFDHQTPPGGCKRTRGQALADRPDTGGAGRSRKRLH